MYIREEVYEATLKYFKNDELATNVWIDKYCLKNDGKFLELTPDDMHKRLAKEFARIEAKYPNPMDEEEIYFLLKDFQWIVPQGSPMAGIGNHFATTSISNCFVIGNHVDSYGGIMKADQEQAQLMKRRGGVGQDISWIRPSGSIAGTTPLGQNAGTTLYMERFSNTTREVQQDGRRGALMLSIDIKHPDAEKFIDKKMTQGSVTAANVSVRISDEFMKALDEGNEFAQVFPCKYEVWDVQTDEQRAVIPEENVLYKGNVIEGVQTYWKSVDPKKIQDKLVYNAWAAAEPGILFWDTILRESPAAGYGAIWKELSTNPCGEIPLPDGDSCRLLVLNLYSYLHRAFHDNAQFEDTLLVDHVKKAQRLMDDIVDLEIEKIDKIIKSIKNKIHLEEFQEVELNLWKRIRQKAVDGRRTGLGITGEGDLIAGLGYKYGTKEATRFSESLHQLIATAAYESSVELAEERGCFPIWEFSKDIKSDFLQRMFGIESNELMSQELFERYFAKGRRNIGVLTIAPTGTVSLLTQTSSGIEPIFAAWYFRKKKITDETEWDYEDELGDKWIEYPVFHRPFVKWYSVHKKIDMIIAEFQLSSLNEKELTKLFEVSPYFEATAQDVDYIEKVRMQGAVQKWVDHSISVTVNMPEEATEEIVAQVFQEAYKSGCKGITVYRDNSRGNVLSTTSIKKDEDSKDFDYVSGVKRPKIIDCDIFYKSAQKQPYIILVGLLDSKPYEIFAVPNSNSLISSKDKFGTIHKKGKGVYNLNGENGELLIKDLTSYMIESEQNTTRLISGMLRHRTDPKYVAGIISKFATINSFHKVVGKVLNTYIEDNEITCKCGGKIIITEGCEKCTVCGNAKCG